MSPTRSILTLLLALATAAARAESGRTALLAEGPPRVAVLAAIEPGRVVLDDGRPQSIALADLVEWGVPPEAPARPLVVLADGGLLAAETIAGDRQSLRAESEQFGGLELATAAVAGLVLRAPTTQRERDLLLDRIARVQTSPTRQRGTELEKGRAGQPDAAVRLILANGDQLQGRLLRISRQSVELAGDVGPITVARSRLTAAVFARPPSQSGPRPPLRIWLGTSDGSRLLADRLESDAKGLRAVLAAGPSIRTRLRDVVWLETVGGRAVHLSDLSAAAYRHVPYLSLAWPYRTDRSVTGAMLRAGGRLYAKGLGMHSAARLTYLLEEPLRRFQAELAVDDQTAGGGSVRFRVFVDGRERFTSATIRGGDRPAAISVDVAGAKRLDLVVDFADRADQLDHADWLNARLVR